MSNSEEDDEISRTAGKRKFLLTDEDLVVLPFKMKPNPINKGYAPMKVYEQSSLEKIAIKKHGSLKEIKAKQDKRGHTTKTKIENKEEETRNLWDREEVFEPMKQFMTDIDVPVHKKSQYFETRQSPCVRQGNKDEQILIENSSGDLLNNNIIIHYFDCMHHRAKGAGGYAVHHKFPKAAILDQQTPYNDRRKMGHFCWFITESNQLLVILYVQHKFPKLAPNSSVVPVMNYDALYLGLQRLYNLLETKLQDDERSTSPLSTGTYLPYKADQTKFTEAYNKAFKMPVHLHTFQEVKT